MKFLSSIKTTTIQIKPRVTYEYLHIRPTYRPHVLLSLAGLFLSQTFQAVAQTPTASPSPTDNRGLGLQSSGATTTQSSQQAKEAKPELVLQTGYNQLFGATRVVFSPDGRLMATGTFRSSSIKLWETATSRKLRELATNSTSSTVLSPAVAFSRDNRFVAAAAGDNSVKMWDVGSGREVQTFAGTQGTMMAAMGVVFIGFASDNRLVTVGTCTSLGRYDRSELRTIEGSVLSTASLTEQTAE
jgi:WD40 repeat protein